MTKIFSANDILNIVLQNLYKTISTAAAIVMFAGFVVCVTFNFVTIKMSQIIPMPIFLVFPSVSVGIQIILNVMMPIMINVCVGGEEVV